MRLVDLIGEKLEEKFLDFDLTEVQEVLKKLKDIEPIDLAHAELLQQQALRGADVVIEYLGKIVKTVGYLESKVNSIKNKEALEYQTPDGTKATTDMRKWWSEQSPEVISIQESLAKARAAKTVLEKKYDLLIKSHHHYKEIASGMRKGIVGYSAGYD